QGVDHGQAGGGLVGHLAAIAEPGAEVAQLLVLVEHLAQRVPDLGVLDVRAAAAGQRQHGVGAHLPAARALRAGRDRPRPAPPPTGGGGGGPRGGGDAQDAPPRRAPAGGPGSPPPSPGGGGGGGGGGARAPLTV